jgi:pimeloyl-ACP methyl ester carboxylesterase
LSARAPRERTLATPDNLRLYFQDWGDPDWPSTPVLCLHGLVRNSRDFAILARHLSDPDQAKPRRVIAADMRGRGRSQRDPDWRHYNGRTYVEDIRHLLASLGIGRFIAVGISMGGLLAIGMATAMPTALAGIVVDDAGPEVGRAGSGRILQYISVDRPQPDWPSAAKAMRTLLPTLSLRTEEEWIDFARATYAEGSDGMLHFDWDTSIARPLQAEMAGETGNLWNLWRAVGSKPALVIRGGVSDILSAETLSRMQAEKPDLVHYTLPGVGHAPTMNEPPVREVLDEFLRQL